MGALQKITLPFRLIIDNSINVIICDFDLDYKSSVTYSENDDIQLIGLPNLTSLLATAKGIGFNKTVLMDKIAALTVSQDVKNEKLKALDTEEEAYNKSVYNLENGILTIKSVTNETIKG